MLERFSRDRALRRRLPSAFGSRAIYVSPDSALRFWGRDISSVDPELFVLAEKVVRPGAIVWDIGANVGLFSFAAAAKAGVNGKVLAVEPDPWLGALLRRSAVEVVPDAAPVEVLNVAVSDRLGIVEFNIAKRGRSSNFVSGFGATQAGGSRNSFPVVVITLDWLAEHTGQPAIVKIDVEAMEHLVLRGAREVLRSRPVIIT
jgi:FkbM family methyltransferase